MHIRRLVATTVLAAGAATAAAGGSAHAGPSVPPPSPGTIHLYGVSTSTGQQAHFEFVIDGSFADHGRGTHGTLNLSRGKIDIDTSALTRQLQSPNFGHFDPTTCAYDGVASGTLAVTGGSGAYKGITGSGRATLTRVGIEPRTASGACNGSAPDATAEDAIVEATLKVSF